MYPRHVNGGGTFVSGGSLSGLIAGSLGICMTAHYYIYVL